MPIDFISKTQLSPDKDPWATNSCLDERIDHSNPRNLSKIQQK